MVVRSDGTHVEDMKNPVEVQSPGGNRLFVVLRIITSRNCVPFASPDDISLNLVHSPG